MRAASYWYNSPFAFIHSRLQAGHFLSNNDMRCRRGKGEWEEMQRDRRKGCIQLLYK